MVFVFIQEWVKVVIKCLQKELSLQEIYNNMTDVLDDSTPSY